MHVQKKRQSCASLQELRSLHLHGPLATTPCCSGALARTQRSPGPTPCCALARTQRRSSGPSPGGRGGGLSLFSLRSAKQDTRGARMHAHVHAMHTFIFQHTHTLSLIIERMRVHAQHEKKRKKEQSLKNMPYLVILCEQGKKSFWGLSKHVNTEQCTYATNHIYKTGLGMEGGCRRCLH